MDNKENQDKPENDQSAPEPIVINKASFTMSSKWLRLLFMILFVFCHYIARMIVYLLAIVQFVVVLVNDKPNENLLKFGQGLSYYAYQIFRYLSYNTEEKPFPFNPWPSDKV